MGNRGSVHCSNTRSSVAFAERMSAARRGSRSNGPSPGRASLGARAPFGKTPFSSIPRRNFQRSSVRTHQDVRTRRPGPPRNCSPTTSYINRTCSTICAGDQWVSSGLRSHRSAGTARAAATRSATARWWSPRATAGSCGILMPEHRTFVARAQGCPAIAPGAGTIGRSERAGLAPRLTPSVRSRGAVRTPGAMSPHQRQVILQCPMTHSSPLSVPGEAPVAPGSNPGCSPTSRQ